MSPREPKEEVSVTKMFDEAIMAGLRHDDDQYQAQVIDAILEQRDKAFEVSIWRMRTGDEVERTLAVHIVGRLSADRSEDEPDMVERILEFAKRERDDNVQQAIVVALRQSGDPRGVPLLVQYAKHDDPDFRRSVIQSLGPAIAAGRQSDGIDTLISATRDRDDSVRDWATFQLALIISQDTPKIREALMKRTEDENETIRRQAVAGLARRRDQRMIPIVLEALQQTEVWKVDVRAAGYLRSKKFLPALRKLKDWWEEDVALLDASIDLCDIKAEARKYALYVQFRNALEDELKVMFPGIEIGLACDLSQEGGPVIAVAIHYDIDLSFPTVPMLLAYGGGEPEVAASVFAEAVLRDDRFGRRAGRRN